MTAATVTVTRLSVNTNTDSLFDGSDFDPALCDQDATVEAYLDELLAELRKDFPQARITLTHAPTYKTEVSIGTDQDNSDDDATEEAVWRVRDEVKLNIENIEALVWERGTFWVEPQA